MLKQRIKTLLVLVPASILVLCFSHIPYVLNTTVAMLSLTGVYEVYSAAKAKKSALCCFSLLIAGTICFLEIEEYAKSLCVLFPLAVGVFFIQMIEVEADNAKCLNKTKAFFVSCMIPYFLYAIVDLRQMNHGICNVLVMLLSCILTEIAGYFIGGALGKRKLAPKISPHKTWAGSIGGVSLSLAGTLLLAFLYGRVSGTIIHYGCLCLYLACTSIIGQIGDLFMSTLKREAGVKDFGKVLPGHGGILDRFDSQLFAAPFTVIFLNYFCPLFL